MTEIEIVLIVGLPVAALVAGYFLAAWERTRQVARETYLRGAVGPPPSEVDAAVERHFDTLPAWLKGDQP